MTVDIFKHSSGIEVIFDKNDSPLVGINFRVNVGSSNENSKQKGISHYIEHMAFTGTSKLSKEQITKYTEQTGAYINAYTDYTNTTYTLKCMTTNFSTCLGVLSDMLTDCQFFEEEFQKEKGVILQEISDRTNNPNIVAYDQLFNSIYKDEGMNTQIIGTKEHVSSFTRDDLIAYYKDFYIPNNMVLSVSGNVSKEDILSVLDEYFSKESSTGILTEEKEFTITDNKDIVYNNSFSQDTLVWVFKLNHIPCLKINTLRNIVSMYLGSGFSSILVKKFRSELGLVYGISSHIYSIGKYNDVLIINTNCESDKSDTINKELGSTIQQLKKFDQDDLTYCKNMAKFNVANSFESKTKAASNNIYEYKYYGKISTYDENISIIDDITLDDCHKFIDELLAIEPIKFISKSSKKEV